MRDDEFVLDLDAGEHDEAPAPREGRRRLVVVAAAACVLALLAGGVATARWYGLVAPPPPSLPPAPGLVETGGMHTVRLSQSADEFRAVRCAGVGFCADLADFELADDVHDCTWVPVRTDRTTPDGGWAWIRDGRVVGVGIQVLPFVGPPGGGFTSWTGLAEGAVIDPAPRWLRRWERDADAGVTVFRRTHDRVTSTLADVNGDGLLDYAAVATDRGEECAVDPAALLVSGIPPVGASSAIRGDTVLGVRLGMPAAEAASVEGWALSENGLGTCRRGYRTGPLAATPSNGVASFEVDAPDGTVISVGSTSVDGGIRAGMSAAEAAATLAEGTAREWTSWGNSWPGRFLRGEDPEGRPVAAFLSPVAPPIAGLDSQVWGDVKVLDVWVGRSCLERLSDDGQLR